MHPSTSTAQPSAVPVRDAGTATGRSARGPEDVSALSWLVADARTGEVLAAHNAHRKLPPASTLKTLFALTVLPVLPGGIRHTVTEEELAGIGDGSSLVGVAEGRTYRVADLWRGVFLNSGNDAVHVLAAMNGGWRTTAARMQAKARSLGALDTHVVSPDGYDTPGQVSSAYDLAVFGRAGLRNADFARYCSTVRAKFPGGGGWSYEIQNTNRLLTGADGVEPYPGLVGVKNGYTSKAGNTLVAAARRDGRTLDRHGDEPSGGRRIRGVRGGALAARLGLRGRRACRSRRARSSTRRPVPAAGPGGRARGPALPTTRRTRLAGGCRRSRARPVWARDAWRWPCASRSGGSTRG